jgi:general secretion pathway protein C
MTDSELPPEETTPPESDHPIDAPPPSAGTVLREKLEQFRHRLQTIDLHSALAQVQTLLQSLGKRGSLPLAGKLATVILSTWFAAGGAAIFLEKYIPEPGPSTTRSRFSRSGSAGSTSFESLAAIWDRNLFSSKGLLPGEEGDEGPSDPGGAPVKSSLPLNLIGTLVLRDELRSIATIEDKSASLVYPLRAEDEIPGKIRVLGVESRRVIFLNLSSSRREFLELPVDNTSNARVSLGAKTALKSDSGKPGVEQLSATQYNVARSEIDAALSDLNKILTQARAVPNFENGQPNGYKLFQIVPGSIYDKLGLKNGDLLLGINGQGMSDPAKAFEMLSELKNQSHVEISVKRDGKASNFAYEIR